MDKILFNACVRTLDDKNTIAEAVGMKDGRICFIGTNEEAENLEYKERIDLEGKLVLPGFVDTHLHMLNYAFVEKSVKLFTCKSVEEMLEKAKRRIEDETEISWLYCRGWNEEHFENPRYPQKDELDAISGEIPIIMVRVCGHVAVCNSCGLERIRKIKEFPEFEKDIDF